MPLFTYAGPDRYYPTLGLEAVDGDSHDFDEAPDGNWTAPAAAAVPSAPVPAPSAQPVNTQE